MLLDILNPQGDPYAEPQVPLMSSLVVKGVIGEMAKDIDDYALRANRIDEEHNVKAKRYIHRFLLLVAMVMKFCDDRVKDHLALDTLTKSVDHAVSVLDPQCTDKILTMEFLKYLKKVVSSQDSNISRSLLDANHFITIIKKVHRKNNILASQVNSICEELRKLHCFKLQKQFIESHREVLEEMSLYSQGINALLTHYEWIKNTTKSNMESTQKGSETKDPLILPTVNSRKISDVSLPDPEELAHSREQIAILVNKVRTRKSGDEDDDDSDDIFFSMKTGDRVVDENPISGSGSPLSRSESSTQRIEFSLVLDKRQPFDNDEEDGEMSEDSIHPNKKHHPPSANK